MLTRHKALTNQLLQPIAQVFVRLGIAPSVITIGCPLLMAIACWSYVRTRNTAAFCLAALLIGLLDGVDGVVARATRTATAFGGYLDALCDRYVDAMVAITAAYVTGHWVLSMLVLSGSLLISYAKARAAMEVAISNQEWPDLMERAERGILFLAGLAASSLVPWQPLGKDLFWWTLVVLSVLVHATVVQRMIRAVKFIRERASG